MTDQFSTPILFLVFNRPDTTQKVFDSIRSQRPTKLYIAADGPRSGKPNEAEKCNEVRNIVSDIDWDCEVKTLYRDHNLGCKIAVSSAISWFFEQEEEGIILEDDCLAHPDFFRYCNQMLSIYKNEESVALISGYNGFSSYLGIANSKYNYFFSKFPNVWGWASWRRVWENYDVNISDWKKDKKIITFVLGKFGLLERELWKNMFDDIYYNKINTWDAQVSYLCFKNNLKTIYPTKNLIENIGFNVNATHTFTPLPFQLAKSNNFNFPIIKQDTPYINCEYDKVRSNVEYSYSIFKYLKIIFKKILLNESFTHYT